MRSFTFHQIDLEANWAFHHKYFLIDRGNFSDWICTQGETSLEITRNFPNK